MPAHHSITKSKGFTLIELLTVMVVVGILATLAGPTFTRMIERNRIKSTSSDLQISLFKARSEAIKRNGNVTVTPVGGNWQDGWQVQWVDGGGTTVDLLNIQNVEATITPSNAGAITYMSSGRISGAANRDFDITGANLSLPAEFDRCVSVNLSGMPVIKKGACP